MGDVRDGWGLVYCTNHKNKPCLYECQWDKLTPVNGRMIAIGEEGWVKYEGAFDDEYLLTGTGNMQRENGDMYEGEWKRGEMHGRGKLVFSDGRSYEGGWKEYSYHGQGRRYTYPDGTYYEGQWEEKKQIGVHMEFNKDGRLKRLISYEKGQAVNVERLQ